MFSQWVRGMPLPLGRLSWAHISGVWGIRSNDRIARTRIRADSTGNSNRTMAVYQPAANGSAASQASAWVNSFCTSIPPFRMFHSYDSV